MKWVSRLCNLNTLITNVKSGLGKTVQVISFLAHLRDMGNKGPHLIVVP